MTTENHPIDQLFKEKLGNFEQIPPAGLLNKINQEIAFRGRVRRMNRLKTIASIAAALVLVAIAGWYTFDLNLVTKNKFSQQILPANPPVRSEVKNGTSVPKPIENQFSANQQKTGKIASIQQITKSETSSRFKGKASKPSATAGNDALVVQPSGKEPVASVESTEAYPKKSLNREATTVTKGESETKTASNTFLKKNGLNYYADSKPANPAPSPKKGNWSIRAEISPMFSTEKLSSNTKSRNTLGGGMMASFQVNERVKISSGIRFSQMKQGTYTNYTLSKTSGITYLQPVEKAANISRDVSLYLPSVSSIVYSKGMNARAATYNTSTTNYFESDVSQEFKYLEVPIQATYTLINQKQLSVGITGGLSTNFLIGNMASITQNGIKLSQGNTDNLRNVLYSSSAGIELGYNLGKNLILTVEPRVKQYLHSISSNDLIIYRPLQLGVFTGITYSFH